MTAVPIAARLAIVNGAINATTSMRDATAVALDKAPDAPTTWPLSITA